MSKITNKRKFSRSVYPNFGYCDDVDKDCEQPLTYYYNCFRNEMKEYMGGADDLTQDKLRDIRYSVRQFCDTQANLFQTPKYFFSQLVSDLMFARKSEDADNIRARIMDILCREYTKLRKNKLIKKHLRNPMWKIISHLTLYMDNKLVLFNMCGIMFFYEV